MKKLITLFSIIFVLCNVISVAANTTDWRIGINAFFDEYGITAYRAVSTLLGTWTIVKSNVDAGKPLVIGMTSIAGSQYGNQVVTVYAYNTDFNGKGYYINIDNWEKNYDIAIETSWTIDAAELY